MDLLPKLCIFPIIALAPLLPSVAIGESWVAIPTESTNMLFSIDEASRSRNGDVVKFWERLVFLVPEQRDESSGKMVKEKRIHRVMNCARKTQGHLYTSLIAPDGRQIEAVYRNEASVEIKLVAPSSVAAKELEWACSSATLELRTR